MDLPLDDELMLVAQAKQGNMGAFEALYNLHKAPIFHVALAITGDRHMAEEILQEVFLRVYKHIQNVRSGTPLAPWLYRITVNLTYDMTAKQHRGQTMLQRLRDWLPVTPLKSPERQVEEQEFQKLVFEAINKLEFRQRTTLVLFYLQGFSMAEIAEIMDCPLGTVKSRLHYARVNLRKALLADDRLLGDVVYDLA